VTLLVALLLAAGGVVGAAWASRELLARRRELAVGRLVAVDLGDGPSTALSSERYRLRGRPDAIRRAPDGTLVPVEVKRRPAPPGGPYPSHLAQLWAYALLLEDATGRPPPFGILRYSDRDVRVAWDDRARGRLLEIRRELARPYDGRATPSLARCRGCRWAPICDARAPGA
jgi:CRISPR-associated exonuclease Cas4